MNLYYNSLIKEFKDKNFESVYLFYGKENYIIDNVISFLKNKVVDDVYKDFNYKEIDYKNSNISDVLSTFEILPFMSEYTFTIIKNVDSLFKEITEDESERLVDYLMKPNKTSVVIFIGENIDKRKKVFKKFKKHSTLFEFKKLNNIEFPKWVNKYFTDNGKVIRNRELSYLVKETGYLDKNSDKSLYSIIRDFEKIINYSDDELVTTEIIDKFIDKPIEDNIFLLIDSIFNNQTEKAFDILNLMDSKNEPLQVILFMIIKQFRVILKIKILIETGLTSKNAGEILGIHSYVAKKSAVQAKEIDYKILKKILKKSIEVDRLSKSSSIDLRLIIESYIVEIANLIN